jgi:hypothetical protein
MAELDNAPAQETLERISAALQDGGGAKPDDELVEVPSVFQEEELGATRPVKPYAAYAPAGRSQERTLAFWTYVDANSPDTEVQDEAERLAKKSRR